MTIAAMGESALLVSFGDRMSLPLNDLVQRLRHRLLHINPPGVVDVVPAYASLLVTFDHERMVESELRDLLADTIAHVERESSGLPAGGKHHIIPVQYGGEACPDLLDVAELHGLTPQEVVRLHTSRVYKVAFLGFLPGFAYMGRLSPMIATPRLATPRTRVSGGSVGIAGAQTGIYPFASPGGWRIIGRTSLPIWNPAEEPPARFAPGDTVQFAQSDYEPAVAESVVSTPTPARPAFEVLSAGGFSTVQDLGRPGLAHLGVGRGGVFDASAAIRANALVGNEQSAALLEMTWSGPTLRALRNITIALNGADLECRAGGALIPPGLSWFVRSGIELRFSRTHSGRGGVRAYLAASGGFDVPPLLGSRSTSIQAHFGGYGGRALQAGDVLGVGQTRYDDALVAGKYWPGKTAPITTGNITLRFMPYEGRGRVALGALREFTERVWILGEQADRMGFRFRAEAGQPLTGRRAELVSFGVVRGAIQLPPDGNPVVLNVDHQTTGGYPLVGVVAEVDWPLLAQLSPGARVRFVRITVEEARASALKTRQELRAGVRLLTA